MNRWKAIAMMSVGFICGVAYTAACGSTKGAEADSSSVTDSEADSGTSVAPLPTDAFVSKSRAVFYVSYKTNGKRCVDALSQEKTERTCCPAGFSSVGVHANHSDAYPAGASLVCLEDA